MAAPQFLVFVALLYAAAATPSPTPSTTPIPYVAPAPTDDLGKYLGRAGLETHEFRKRCGQCCRTTQLKYSGQVNFLRGCDKCHMRTSLEPPNAGHCGFGAPLGFTRTASECFFDRCQKMLMADGPCMCFSPVYKREYRGHSPR